MIWITKRIIEYLKSQTAVTNLLASSNDIRIENFPNSRPKKYVTVSTGIGRDGNNIGVNFNTITVTAAVSRTEANAHSNCLSIAGAIDDTLNKSENSLSDNTYDVLHFCRVDDSNLQIDNEKNEYYFEIVYEYILEQ